MEVCPAPNTATDDRSETRLLFHFSSSYFVNFDSKEFQRQTTAKIDFGHLPLESSERFHDFEAPYRSYTVLVKQNRLN